MSFYKNGYLKLNLDSDILCNDEILNVFNSKATLKKIDFDNQYSYITKEIEKLDFQFDIKKIVLKDKIWKENMIYKDYDEIIELYVFRKKYVIDIYNKLINTRKQKYFRAA